jgi:hypothetical protein
MLSSAAVARLSRTLVRPLAGSSSAWSASARPFATSFRLPDPALAGDFVELTKIVATIGPTSEQAGPLQSVTEAGMKIMRLNFSHATVEEVEMRCTNLDAAEVSSPWDRGMPASRLQGRTRVLPARRLDSFDYCFPTLDYVTHKPSTP